jgi:hypothetical protein
MPEEPTVPTVAIPSIQESYSFRCQSCGSDAGVNNELLLCGALALVGASLWPTPVATSMQSFVGMGSAVQLGHQIALAD